MRKWKVRAEVTEYDIDFESGRKTKIVPGVYETEVVLANDEDEACDLFKDMQEWKHDKFIELDDYMWHDLGPANVYINSNPYDGDTIHRSDYGTNDLTTMTVGDLIEVLSKFDKDAKVYLKNEKEIWNVFSGIAPYDIEEAQILD